MSVVHRAEAATLGGVLLDPEVLADLGWLRGRDFADPWHGMVFDLLREVATEGAPPGVVDVARALLHRHGGRVADLPRLADLITATPVPARPRAYAAMVLEASIRRDVAGQGVLLRAGALQAALTGTAHPVAATVGLVHATLDGLEQRWQQATPGRTTRPDLPASLVDGAAERPPLGTADRLLAAHPPLDQAAVRAHERDLVAALVTRPQHAAQVAAWLRPEQLTDRSWAAVYAAVLDLVDAGSAVDEVTLGWRVTQASRRLGPGPDPADLHAAVEQMLTEDPRWLARLVAADQVRRTADAAATALDRAAGNPGLDVADLLGTGHLHADAVHACAAGLPATPQQPAPRHLAAVPTPRAGGPTTPLTLVAG